MLEKHPLVPDRVRRPPKEGWSWIDRRFLREGWLDRLERDEILLYLFLVCVADRHGLSYWSDTRTAGTVKISPESLDRARSRLVDLGMVAYAAPLYQVLDLARPARQGGGGPRGIGEILRGIAERGEGKP